VDDLGDRVPGPTAGPVGVARRVEPALEDRVQDELEGHLHDLALDRQDPEATRPAIALRIRRSRAGSGRNVPAFSIGCRSRGSDRVAGTAEVARPASDGLEPREDSRPDRPQVREAAAGIRGRGPQPVLRGWDSTSRYDNSAAKFAVIDAYVNARLAILASTKHGLNRHGRSDPVLRSREAAEFWAARLPASHVVACLSVLLDNSRRSIRPSSVWRSSSTCGASHSINWRRLPCSV
jgi:hypothetical protein